MKKQSFTVKEIVTILDKEIQHLQKAKASSWWDFNNTYYEAQIEAYDNMMNIFCHQER